MFYSVVTAGIGSAVTDLIFSIAKRDEALDLQKTGADVIQLDELWVRNNPDLAKRNAVKAINRFALFLTAMNCPA